MKDTPIHYQSEKEKLISIITRLEQGDVSIDESLQLLEEATVLSEKLENYITAAETTLKKISRN